MVVPATTSIHNQSWNMNHIVFLLPFLFTQSTTLLLANGFIIHRFPQKPQTSFLSLFSIQSIKNGNNDGNGNDDVSTNNQRNSDTNNKNVTSQEDDFSAWIDGLKQWPLVPSKESEPSVSLTLTSSRYRGSNPFLNIVQLMETLDQEKSIFSIADQLFRNLVETTGFVPSLQNTTTTTVQDLLDSKEWLPIQNSAFLDDPTRNASAIQTAYNYSAWEGILKEATARMEYLVQEASLAPSVLPELIERTSQLFSFSSNSADPSINFLNTTAVESLPEERRQLLQASTNYAANFMTVANTVFTAGYAAPSGSVLSTTLSEQRPLFADFPSAQRITRDQQFDVVRKGAEMGSLAGAIYEDTLARCQGLGHAMIAQGTTSDVAWMVTDSSEDSAWTRTITIRGFDASDDTVDRERLLNAICTPQPELMEGVMFHSGLLTTARAIYPEVIKYLDWSSPQQKIVLNGHSIGGSLAVLVLLLLTAERGGKTTILTVISILWPWDDSSCIFQI